MYVPTGGISRVPRESLYTLTIRNLGRLTEERIGRTENGRESERGKGEGTLHLMAAGRPLYMCARRPLPLSRSGLFCVRRTSEYDQRANREQMTNETRRIRKLCEGRVRFWEVRRMASRPHLRRRLLRANRDGRRLDTVYLRARTAPDRARTVAETPTGPRCCLREPVPSV